MDANIVLTFGGVDAESGKITLFKTGGATAKIIAVGSGLVSVSGNVVTINPITLTQHKVTTFKSLLLVLMMLPTPLNQ